MTDDGAVAFLYQREGCRSVIEKARNRWPSANGWTETPVFAALSSQTLPAPGEVERADSWSNTPEAVRNQVMLLAEVELHLQSTRIFITTREKMHPCGVEIHDELQDKVTAAIDAIGRDKVNG